MDLTPALRFALLLMRPGVVVMLAPGFGGRQIPATARIGLTVLLALALAPSVTLPDAVSPGGLAYVVARELAIGLSLAFALQALVAAAELAGHLASYQMGFSYGATIDPTSGVRSTLFVSLYGMLATLTFLAVNGHHAVLRALAASYAAVPVGGGTVSDSLVTSVRELMAMVFGVGVRLAAPVLIVMVLVELAIGLVSRSAPSLNFMIIGYPVRLVVGLVVVGALIATIPAVTASVIEGALLLGGRTAAAFR